MPQIHLAKVKEPPHSKDVKAKIFSFLQKLGSDDTTKGLHIEPMEKAVDSRARTGRVDIHMRAVLFKIDAASGGEATYIYEGTFDHETAIKRARSRFLKVNPALGMLEVAQAVDPDEVALPLRRVEADAGPVTKTDDPPRLVALGFVRADLADGLGFDEDIIGRAFAAESEADLEALADELENEWQKDAVLALACGMNVQEIRAQLGVSGDSAGIAPGTDDDETERIRKALDHPATKMQFTYIEDDAELQRVIEEGDFGAWRVFLHPEQRAYANRDFNGAFRLTGGAGTGKTVVLLHRARHLSQTAPTSRVVLTTFTKALASALSRDLDRLDESLTSSSRLGVPGVFVSGVDAIASSIRLEHEQGFALAAATVLGEPLESIEIVGDQDKHWTEALAAAGDGLPASARNHSFVEAEYLQVILPNRITSRAEYLGARRPGRGLALDRAKRSAMWDVIDAYRVRARNARRISFAEVAEIASAFLDEHPDARPADHVLVDEAQDLIPSQWRLLRSLVAEGKNDLFVADDIHQRIYGQRVVLSRYGIKIVGRSRRLMLNYRTTQENLAYALGLLSGGEYLDSEEDVEKGGAYRSARRGPLPRALPASDGADQNLAVADTVRAWVSAGVAAETIAVLARSNKLRDAIAGYLTSAGIDAARVDDIDKIVEGRVVTMTMHKAKGMEFSRVILFDVSDGALPNQYFLKDVAEEDLPDRMLLERSLLYVAASRARDELVVTWKGKPSVLLSATRLP